MLIGASCLAKQGARGAQFLLILTLDFVYYGYLFVTFAWFSQAAVFETQFAFLHDEVSGISWLMQFITSNISSP